MAYLRVLAGDRLLEQHELSAEKTTIGRSHDNDILLPSHGVSKHHAMIEKSGQSFILIDNDSANGVYVNGDRIRRRRLLFRTRDHRVADLLKGGSATGSAQTNADLEGNGLYMCLGGRNELEAEFGATAVGKNDWLMLCSDGFWGQVEAEEVANALAAPPKEQKTAADLAALAAQRGGAGGDNASLVLAIREHSRMSSIWRRRLLPSGTRFGK